MLSVIKRLPIVEKMTNGLSKADYELGGYFFNVYGQFVIKKTLLFRLFRCHCAFFYNFVTYSSVRHNNWLMVERLPCKPAKVYCKGLWHFQRKIVLYFLPYNLTCHIWSILSIIPFTRKRMSVHFHKCWAWV